MARILVTGFCAVPGPTRAGVQMRHVVRALNPHVVDLLVVREGDQPYVERQGNGRLLRVPTHDADLRGQVQAYQRALRRQLEGADYDAVHCRDAWGAAAVLEARERFGYAVVFDLARGDDHRGDLDPAMAAQLERDEEACLLAADLVLVPTEAAQRSALGRGLPDRVVLSPPGVDVDRFDWDDVAHVGPPLVVSAGAIGPGRGVRTLLRAMAELTKGVPARLALVGPVAPGFDVPLKAAITELGLVGKVEVRAAVDHESMPSVIAEASICVAPAAPELTPRPFATYPTRLLEYMACRRAVVAPRRGTVALLIDHGREGLLFAPGDHIDLARKLRRLIDDPGLRDRLAANGYDRVRREFTASAARRAIRNAYAELAARPEWRSRMRDEADPSDAVPVAVAVGDPIAVDDDFEATVYEAAPTAGDADGEVVIDVTLDPVVDDPLDQLGPPTGDERPTTDDGSDLDVALANLDADSRPDQPFTEERVLPTSDETSERSVDADSDPSTVFDPDASDGGDGGTGEHPLRPPRPATGRRQIADEWVVRHPGRRRRRRQADEGTPVDTAAAPTTGPVVGGKFVAGEIDVPTPTPELIEPMIEDEAFTAAARLLGTKEPDTGV